MMLNWKRVLAGIIDHGVSCGCASLLTYFFTLENPDSVPLIAGIFSVIYIFCTIFKDRVFRNASIGKKVTKIKLVHVNKDGTHEPIKRSFAVYLKRSLPLLVFPLEIIMIIAENQRIGDAWAHTAVVDANQS
ncbi:MAG: RDD family protein [Clostridiales bacterium]|nr:RDD family protein [Clostridiales bacterium]